MRPLTPLLVLALFLSPGAHAREARPLDVSQVPQQGSKPEDFVPQGWKLEHTVRGDLDKNGREDLVLQLIEDRPAEDADGAPNERHRAVVLLLSADGGKLRRAGVSPRLLYCTTCMGMMSGGGSEGMLEIKNGVLLVSQSRGSRELTGVLLRFRYDPKPGRFLLIGQDVGLRDRATGESSLESTNLLTGQKVVETRRYDEKRDKEVVVSSKKSKGPPKTRFLEDVDIESY
jgi:hypothetical protein